MDTITKILELLFLFGSTMVVCVPVNNLSEQLQLNGSNKCKTIPFHMPVDVEGCQKTFVQNNYCTGHCHSLVASPDVNSPRNVCRICTPDNIYEKVIFIRCKRLVNGAQTWVREPKTVQIVKQCSCNKCPDVKLRGFL